MKISIIIPAYNEAKYLGSCIESILRNNTQLLHEIIVVDNGSVDDTAKIVQSFSGVNLVIEKEKGVTKARAAGFAASSGDIIAYIDADTKMPPGWLAKVSEEFSKDNLLVALSGPYVYHDVTPLQNFLVFVYWIFLAFPSYFFLRYMAVGGNLAVRRDALEKVGGFDKNISFYGDDTDIARRLHKIGKVKFKLSFIMYTSGRRLKGQGVLKTGMLYAINFLSEVFLHRPITKDYIDIR
ncbi:MAG: glycosyltransferase [Patescibacteria group bacterium]